MFFPFSITIKMKGTLLENYETDASQLKESVTVTYSFVQLFMLTTRFLDADGNLEIIK